MIKKNLLLTLSFGLACSFGHTQQTIDNNPKDVFKDQIKNGLDKEEQFNAKNTGVFIPEWRETYWYSQVDQEFELSSKNSYSYQSSNILVEDLVENYDSNAEEFIPSYRNLFSFSGNWEINLIENWDSNQEIWYGSYVDSTEYNMQGDVTYSVQWSFDVNAQEWDLSGKTANDYTYDTNNNIETITISVNDQTGNLILDERETITYDANDDITEVLYEEWDDNLQDWVQSRRAVNLVWHDQEELLFSSVDIEQWDGNNWEPAMRITKDYHSDNTEEMELEEVWDDVNEVYVNEYLEERDLDANMVEISQIAYDWNSVDEEWEIYWGSTYVNTYNNDDELDEQIIENWNSFNEEWILNQKYVYSYIDIASVSDYSKETISIYPNPATEIISINAESDLENVSIVGMNGKTVYNMHKINSANHEVDVNFLNPGTYFVISKTNENQTSKKLVIK